MIFMDNIISDRQFGKVVDLPSFILLFLLFFLLFSTKDITLRNDRKLQQRIFKAPEYSSIEGHNLSWLYLPVRVLGIK